MARGRVASEYCLGYDWLETFVQNGSWADPLLASLSMRSIVQGTPPPKKNDFSSLCTIDSCCWISCGLDCLPGDCAEQFEELCQEGVATEIASECRDELRMLHWFLTYGLCCYIVGCSDSPGCDKVIHNKWTVEKASRQDTQPSGSDNC